MDVATDTTLVSGEGVRLDLPTAGIATRTLAALVDGAIMFGALLLLLLADSLAFRGADLAARQAIAIVEIVGVLAAYPIVMEWTARGRTVGKICLGLRVVRDDGGPIGLRQAVVRGIAGLVLEKPGLLFPFTTLAGVITMNASARDKRLGDMLAGTVVIDERGPGPDPSPPPPWVPPHLQPWALALDLHHLDNALALRIRQFLLRAHALTPDARYALTMDLLDRVLAVIAPLPPVGTPAETVLLSVLAERRRRATPPQAAPWGGGR